MENVQAYLVNAFTADGIGGNPAGVVLHTDSLSNQQKLAIAKEVGFSETAFVCQDNEVDFAVSFFTVTDEVDFCGHATLAAFSTMYAHGLIAEGQYIQRTKAGLLGVYVDATGHVVMEQRLPEFKGVFHYELIAPLIGLEAERLASTNLPIEVVSTGLSDLIVAVPHGSLDSLVVDESRLVAFCKEHNVVGLHAFELCKQQLGVTAHCRNFAPLFGISEESATGSSTGALASYLTKHIDGIETQFLFEQGRAMGCISRLSASIKLQGQTITQVKVGGFAKQFDTQTIHV
ncbi:PhzF family phenazine biosynthesis protein [Pseudoalteromonas xiamenensis]|uniref:PhzF family phenazine biosynthesis protein n=1 Tax=Pseudoalteromonas xiamenensis TaxID=882626 RepID=UPI0035EE0133